jgi:tellurite resistance protein
MSIGDRGERRYVPASFFGMVLGLGGLANSWRAAHRVWGLPAWIGEAVFVVGALVWAVLVLLYVRKWVVAAEQARAELRQPIQCCFVGLLGVATMLIAGGALPHTRIVGLALLGVGGVYTIAFGVWRTGGLWQGGRGNTDTTPVLYLPTVAGSFVLATVAGAAGFADGAQYAFGAGLFSWLAVESVLIHRLYNAPSLVPLLRPTLGIQLAPPTVGLVAYLGITRGEPGIFAHFLLGYGLLQALVLARLVPWIRQQAFGASYWAFSFGATALATAPLRMIERGDAGLVVVLAPFLFVAVNLLIAALAVGTLLKLFSGDLIARPAPAVS